MSNEENELEKASKTKRKKSRAFVLAGYTVQPGERVQFDLPTANLYTSTPLNMSV
ncbi:MAG: hypothetical protein ACJAYE_002871, partial [Candidatus Azotimanducaceae bacterium]